MTANCTPPKLRYGILVLVGFESNTFDTTDIIVCTATGDDTVTGERRVERIERLHPFVDVLRGLIHHIWVALARRQFENGRHGTFAVEGTPFFDEEQFDERRQRDLKTALVLVEERLGVITKTTIQQGGE